MDVVEFLNRLMLAIDRRDYDFARLCLADTVHFDTSSMGGPSRDLTREEMIAGLQGTFRLLKATQHLLSAPVIDEQGDGTVVCVAQYQAYHYRDDLGESGLWVHGGRHHYTLRRRRSGLSVEGLRVEMAWTWGDPAIITAAAC